MKKLRILLLGAVLGCIGSTALTSTAMELRTVGTASVRFAGLLRICDIELLSGGPYDWDAAKAEYPLSLRITYHRKISAERLIKMAELALEDEYTQAVNDAFKDSRDAMNSAYSSVKKGDIYELKYLPSQGLELLLNNTKVASFPDDAFANYYLKIWLGNNKIAAPIIQELKEQR